MYVWYRLQLYPFSLHYTLRMFFLLLLKSSSIIWKLHSAVMYEHTLWYSMRSLFNRFKNLQFLSLIDINTFLEHESEWSSSWWMPLMAGRPTIFIHECIIFVYCAVHGLEATSDSISIFHLTNMSTNTSEVSSQAHSLVPYNYASTLNFGNRYYNSLQLYHSSWNDWSFFWSHSRISCYFLNEEYLFHRFVLAYKASDA